MVSARMMVTREYLGREKEEIIEAKREIERLKQELAKYRELHGSSVN